VRVARALLLVEEKIMKQKGCAQIKASIQITKKNVENEAAVTLSCHFHKIRGDPNRRGPI
jgi:hypothetical protein